MAAARACLRPGAVAPAGQKPSLPEAGALAAGDASTRRGRRSWRSGRARLGTRSGPRSSCASARRARASPAPCPPRPRTSRASGSSAPATPAGTSRPARRRRTLHLHAPRRRPPRLQPGRSGSSTLGLWRGEEVIARVLAFGQAVQASPSRQAAKIMLPGILDLEARTLEQRDRSVRNEDLAWPCERSDPRRGVHRYAAKGRRFPFYFAGVDAGAHLKTVVLGRLGDRSGAANCAGRAVEHH